MEVAVLEKWTETGGTHERSRVWDLDGTSKAGRATWKLNAKDKFQRFKHSADLHPLLWLVKQ